MFCGRPASILPFVDIALPVSACAPKFAPLGCTGFVGNQSKQSPTTRMLQHNAVRNCWWMSVRMYTSMESMCPSLRPYCFGKLLTFGGERLVLDDAGDPAVVAFDVHASGNVFGPSSRTTIRCERATSKRSACEHRPGSTGDMDGGSLHSAVRSPTPDAATESGTQRHRPLILHRTLHGTT